MVWLPVLGLFNVHTDANACDSVRGLNEHRKRESAMKVDSGGNIFCGDRGNPRQQRAGPTLYQLSYTPTPWFHSFKVCHLRDDEDGNTTISTTTTTTNDEDVFFSVLYLHGLTFTW